MTFVSHKWIVAGKGAPPGQRVFAFRGFTGCGLPALTGSHGSGFEELPDGGYER